MIRIYEDNLKMKNIYSLQKRHNADSGVNKKKAQGRHMVLSVLDYMKNQESRKCNHLLQHKCF